MAATMSEELSCFATYASAVLVKMVLMSPLTAYMRITRKVRPSEVDFQFSSGCFDDENS